MINQITKGKAKQERPNLHVIHYIEKDGDGNVSIGARQLDPKPAKLKESVGPDVVQQAEETAHKLPKAQPSKPKTEKKEKDAMTDEQRSVLKAVHDLGGKDKDIHSMDIAKKLGFDKKYPNAPRGPVRNAMESLHALNYVTSKKEGIKYSFQITDRGVEALKVKHPTTPKDKEAGSVEKAAPVSNPSSSEKPSNTDIQCPKCSTFNPYGAEFCKECGEKLQLIKMVSVVA